MVISTVNQVVYNGDGVTTAWPYTFRIIDATDIKLTIIDADGTETDITSDYFVDTVNSTVYYPGYAPGAEPALTNQPAPVQTGQKLMIYRKLPITQEKDLGDKWPFYVIELGLDKLTMILQDIWDWCGRCLQVSRGQAADAGDDFDPTIPLEANKVIAGNANGTGFEAREAMMEVNGAWDGEGRQIHGVADPSADHDAATKDYVDTLTDGNFMKLQDGGAAWEGRGLPVSNIATPGKVKDATTKEYVDNLIDKLSVEADRYVVFNTVAAMKVADLPAGYNTRTLGYHDINDGGAGTYSIRGKVTGETEDGGSVIFLENGNVAELIAGEVIYPEQWGAYGDGIHPDGNAVRHCFLYGSGRKIKCTKRYYLDGYVLVDAKDEEARWGFSAVIGDGTEIDGGTFIFPNNGYADNGDTAFGVNLFYGDNFTIKNAVIDMNGYNNFAPDRTTYGAKTMFAIRSSMCTGITIENCSFKNSAGINYICVTSGEYFTIKNCHFKNGGTNLILDGQKNVNCLDFSYVYLSCDFSLVENNIIEPPDNIPFTYCGGVEVHGSYSTVANNVINTCNPAIYVAKHQWNNNTIENVTIQNNKMLNVVVGVNLFSNLSYKNITVANNHIVLTDYRLLNILLVGISNSTNSFVDSLLIEGNFIESTRQNTYVDRAFSLINPSNVTIQNNNVVNCISFINIRIATSVANIRIQDNRITGERTDPNQRYLLLYRDSNDIYINSLLVKNNYIGDNYPEIINDASFIQNSLIECASSKVPNSLYMSGIFKCDDSVTVNGWNVKLNGKQFLISKDITLEEEPATYAFPTTFSYVMGASLTPKGSNAAYITHIIFLNTNSVYARLYANGTAVTSVSARLYVDGLK